jgi:hypothetical protein
VCVGSHYPNPNPHKSLSRRFDMIGKRPYKPYTDLTNIIVCVPDGTLAGKEHDVSENAHLVSTLPDPGAADDALSVGVMHECIRVSRIHLLGHQLVLLCSVRCSSDVYNCLPRLAYCSVQSCRGNRSRTRPTYFPRDIILLTREPVTSCLRFPYKPDFASVSEHLSTWKVRVGRIVHSRF